MCKDRRKQNDLLPKLFSSNVWEREHCPITDLGHLFLSSRRLAVLQQCQSLSSPQTPSMGHWKPSGHSWSHTRHSQSLVSLNAIWSQKEEGGAQFCIIFIVVLVHIGLPITISLYHCISYNNKLFIYWRLILPPSTSQGHLRAFQISLDQILQKLNTIIIIMKHW